MARALKILQRALKYDEAKEFHGEELAQLQAAPPVAPTVVPPVAPAQKYCMKCGAELRVGQKFRKNCGSPVQGGASPA